MCALTARILRMLTAHWFLYNSISFIECAFFFFHVSNGVWSAVRLDFDWCVTTELLNTQRIAIIGSDGGGIRSNHIDARFLMNTCRCYCCHICRCRHFELLLFLPCRLNYKCAARTICFLEFEYDRWRNWTLISQLRTACVSFTSR